MQIFGAVSGAEIMRHSITESTATSINLGSINSILFTISLPYSIILITIIQGGCNTGTLTSSQALAIEVMFSINMLYAVYGTAFNLKQREIYGPYLPPFLIGNN